MDDDDFGDFGGFEAAEAVTPVEAKPLPAGLLEAGPTPWAVISGSTPASAAAPSSSDASTEEFAEFQNGPGIQQSSEVNSIPWSTPSKSTPPKSNNASGTEPNENSVS